MKDSILTTNNGDAETDKNRAQPDANSVLNLSHAPFVQASFEAIADTLPQIVWITDSKGRATYFNRRCYEYTGMKPEQCMGNGFADAIHPEDRQRMLDTWQSAWQGGQQYQIEYRIRRYDGVYRIFLGRGEPLCDPISGMITMWVGTSTDITELRDVEAATVQSEARKQFLADLTDRIRTKFDPEEIIAETVHSIGEYLAVDRCTFADIDLENDTCTVHPDYCADGIQSIAGAFSVSSFGSILTSEFKAGRVIVVNDIRANTAMVTQEFVNAYEQIAVRSHITAPFVHSALVVFTLGVHCTEPRHWTQDEVELLQMALERTCVTIEVARRQQAVQSELKARRETARTQAWFTALVRNSTDFIGYAGLDNRTIFVNEAGRRMIGLGTDPESDAIIANLMVKDYFYDEDREFAMNDFVPSIYRTGQGVTEMRFRNAITGEPIWVNCAGFTVADPETGEVAALVMITRDISERKAQDSEHDQRYAEEHARAERDSVLARIGAAVRLSLPASEVQAVAVKELGKVLGVDRCYYASVNSETDCVDVVIDYHSDTVPSIMGSYPIVNIRIDFNKAFKNGGSMIVPDVFDLDKVEWDEDMATYLQGMGIRSLVLVPFFDRRGEFVARLAVAMANEPRAWTKEEVHLIESVAYETNEAVKAAHAQQRVQNISRHLQDALLPPAPPLLPGLALKSFYRPALNEAEVGGDGFDVFELDNDSTALCVFDLSGKGLGAASRVATLRNMMRFALYNSLNVLDAVFALNKTLTQRRLLEAFATMFVAIYNHKKQTLTYVNCGQEAGLIWHRSTGEVEELLPTGPVIGALENGIFTDRSVALEAGDIIGIFTDGMTEVGPTRQEFLSIEGLVELFGGYANEEVGISDVALNPEEASRVAGAIVTKLISGAEMYAGSEDKMRDDIALLVGVVTGQLPA